MPFSPAKLAWIAVLVTTLAQAGGTPTAPAINYSEVARKTITVGDHTVTLVRVRPPILPKISPPPPPSPAREPTAEEIATEDRLARKASVTLNVSASVYLDGNEAITEIRWRNREAGDVEYRAWSSADFRYLTQVTRFESDTTVYSWFPFVAVSDWTSLPAEEIPSLPKNLGFSKTQAEYYVDEQAQKVAGQETVLAGLDYLHAYYQLHQKELKSDFEKGEKENAARERQLREHPPKTPDAVIYFWPIKSRQK